MTTIRSLTRLALCAVLVLGFLGVAQAQDKKADATGTWTWTRPARNGGTEQKITLKLKVEGDKVTGKVTSPGRQDAAAVETEIKDGKIKGDEISFTVTREYNGNTMTQKYSGKVTADAIKGKIESERNGQPQSRDWEAKRVTEKK